MPLSAVDVSFTNVAIVVAVAFAAPLALGLVPRLRLPAVVLEIVLGIVVGPQALGLAEVDDAVQVLNLLGLAFLLLIAGLEVDFERLRGRLLRVTGIVFVVLAEQFGLEAILGAFLAGAVLKLVDTDRAMTHPQFHRKLEAAGFGVFVPFFFVTSGLKFDLDALFASAGTVARVPLFLAALLAARGLPALLYRGLVGTRRSLAAGLLQATSLGFFVVAGELGVELGLINRAPGAAP